VYAATAEPDGKSIDKLISVNGLLLSAEFHENRALLSKISPTLPANFSSRYYRGSLRGHPESALRVSRHSNGRWRGVMVFDGLLYRVASPAKKGDDVNQPLVAELVNEDEGDKQLCGMSAAADSAAPMMSNAVIDSQDAISALSLPVSSADLCSNSIDGVCLLPKVEFAYDLSYQALPSSEETPLERAVREINATEMFFETSFGFRFSQISLTMLNAEQHQQIEDAIPVYRNGAAEDGPNALLNALNGLRTRYKLPYLQGQRSLFHFVTGRNFPRNSDNANVVGLAYVGTVCSAYGQGIGLTDAGDTSLVSLVMAHELGHNMGALHDDQATNGCPANEYVMTASIGPSGRFISDFSSCSIDTINNLVATKITELHTKEKIAQCVAYPIEIEIEPDLNNPIEPPKASNFYFDFNILVNDDNSPLDNLQVSGQVADPAQGQIVSAVLTGGNCSVSGANSFVCNATSPVSTLTLRLEGFVAAQAEQFLVTASVSSNTVGTVDVNASNNMASVEYNSFYEPQVPPQSNNQTNTQGNTASGGSSGGGGSMGFIYVFLMAIAAVLKSGNGFKVVRRYCQTG
jgi:hypothetical protein